MLLSTVVYLNLWLLIFVIAYKLRKYDYLANFFLVSQFFFVGVGLVFWKFLSNAAIESFPTYNLSSLTDESFFKANFVLLLGVYSTYFSYILWTSAGNRNTPEYRFQLDCFPSFKIIVLLLLTSIPAFYFLSERTNLLFLALTASGTESLIALVEAREVATSSFFLNIIIYNILPASSFCCFAGYLRYKSTFWKVTFYFTFILSTVCLFLVFQKRPLLVYYIGLALTYIFSKQTNESSELKLNIFKTLYDLKKIFFILFCVLVAFYYFYTTHRFEVSFIDALALNIEAAFSRVFGRLSIPALMYIQYYPEEHDHYIFSNVGLFSNVFGFTLYKDVVEVASHFSIIGKQGSLAASVFIDLYGGFGLLGVFLGGQITGFILFLVSRVISNSYNRQKTVYFSVTAIIFIYYLSQASLFRSLLGYGGLFYLVVGYVLYTRFTWRGAASVK